MAVRDDVTRRIAKKQQEISGLEQQIADLTQQIGNAKAYVQAMEDMLKLMDREAGGPVGQEQPSLRKGSNPARAHRALSAAGRPLHVTKLLEATNQTVNRANRSSMSSALAAYVRRGEYFTRPAPNTFGLVGWSDEMNANLKDSGSEGESDGGDSGAAEDDPPMRMVR